MADKREVFTILEDDSTAEGVKLPARAEGDTSGGNHAPVMAAKDDAGNYKLIELKAQGAAAGTEDAVVVLGAVDSSGNLEYVDLRTAGQAASGVNNTPVLPVKDLAGNLQHINARDEGDAISGVDALPVLGFKDKNGNFKYGKVNDDGELVVSMEGVGTPLSSTDIVTPAGINTLTTIVELTLTASKVVEEIKVRASCMFPTKWELIQVNDVTLTVKDSFLTGAGQYSFSMHYANMEITTGGSGTQKLRLRATQLSGSASDQHGYIECFQKD